MANFYPFTALYDVVPRRAAPRLDNSVRLLDSTLAVEAFEGPRRSTVVRLQGSRFAAVGVAIKNPADAHDGQLGVDVAMARALRALADVIDRHTDTDTRG